MNWCCCSCDGDDDDDDEEEEAADVASAVTDEDKTDDEVDKYTRAPGCSSSTASPRRAKEARTGPIFEDNGVDDDDSN